MAKNSLQSMRRELADNLELEGVTVPSSGRLTTLLNRAKDHVVAQLELCNEGYLTVRKTFTVVSGDASIALPDGSSADVGCKRVLLINRTDLGYDLPGIVVSQWQREKHQDTDGFDTVGGGSDVPVMYVEGTTLYFARRGGAVSAMTLVVSYVGEVVDIAESDLTATYARVPIEWADLIPCYATVMGIPSSNAAGRSKWVDIYRDRLQTLERSVPGRFKTGPLQVQPDDRW